LFAQRVCRPLPPLLSGRLLHVLYPWPLARADRYESLVRAQTGSWLRTTTGDVHGHPFCARGLFEWRSVALALARCPEGSTIVEVGSNVGTETVCLADIVGPTGRVHAFEALPGNCAKLRTGLSLNPNRNVVLHSVAVSDVCGTAEFVVPGEEGESGLGHLLPGLRCTSQQTVRVPTATLDSLGSELGAVRMILSDIEGAEPLMLRGAAQVIAREQPDIVLEAEAQHLRRVGFSLELLYDQIRELGYRAFLVSKLGLRPLADRTTLISGNWLCLHESQAFAARRASKAVLECALLPCLPGINPLTRLRHRASAPAAGRAGG
jgi:FkbM family methyltransferase